MNGDKTLFDLINFLNAEQDGVVHQTLLLKEISISLNRLDDAFAIICRNVKLDSSSEGQVFKIIVLKSVFLQRLE